MATEIKSWQIVNGQLTQVSSTMSEHGRKEAEHLEQWIKTNHEILGDDIAIIGEQVRSKSGRLDFLGIDREGNLVIIELKRDRLAREVLTQAIDYASDMATYDRDALNSICLEFTEKELEDYLSEKFEVNLEEIEVNQEQRILLVGFGIDDALERMINWLSKTYDMPINAMNLQYIMTVNGDELLSRTMIIPEDIEKEKVNKKKLLFQMSNEPGSYDEMTLREMLRKYFTKEKNAYSANRIRDYFIPVLLRDGLVTREQMVKEFVAKKGAINDSQAGSYLSLISSQLGLKRGTTCAKSLISNTLITIGKKIISVCVHNIENSLKKY